MKREKKVGRPQSDNGQRQAIVQATLNCIGQYGYESTTVSRICKATGLSAGNIHYYFGGKQNLLEEAMQMLIRKIYNEMSQKLRKAVGPVNRVHTIIESNLDPSLFNQEICVTWLHFWAQSPHDHKLARLEKINRRWFRRNLFREFLKLGHRDKAALLSKQVVAMVDGFWVEKAQSTSTITSEEAIFMVKEFLAYNLRNSG